MKTLGIWHGYNIDNDKLWKDKIEKIKNCLQVWKTRNLSYQGKNLILKSLVIAQIGFEIEMRGIPDKFLREIDKIIWSFVWDSKIDLVQRNVCTRSSNVGGLGIINLNSYVKSKHIKMLYKIIHSDSQSWNALGKFYLKSYDNKFADNFFLCKCSNFQGLDLSGIPLYYKNSLKAFSELRLALVASNKTGILKERLFGNDNIKINRKPLLFPSFSKSNIKTINDIYDINKKQFKDTQYIYNSLKDKRNWISEYCRIKKAIPENFLIILKNDIINESQAHLSGFSFNSNLEILDKTNKTINHKKT